MYLSVILFIVCILWFDVIRQRVSRVSINVYFVGKNIHCVNLFYVIVYDIMFVTNLDQCNMDLDIVL